MSKTSSVTPGPLKCSLASSGPSRSTPSSSTTGKSKHSSVLSLFKGLNVCKFCANSIFVFLFRIYEHIFGNVDKKDLNFQKVIEENFGHKKLVELITMVHEQKITVANAKQVMFAIVDGDERMPSEIAEDQGFVGRTNLTQEVQSAVDAAVSDSSNYDVIQKIVGGNDRPIMAIVGQVMKAVNRRGDPVIIKKLISEAIEQGQSAGGFTAPGKAEKKDE